MHTLLITDRDDRAAPRARKPPPMLAFPSMTGICGVVSLYCEKEMMRQLEMMRQREGSELERFRFDPANPGHTAKSAEIINEINSLGDRLTQQCMTGHPGHPGHQGTYPHTNCMHPAESPPTTAKERRRLARMTAAVTWWWDSLPEANRLPYYSPRAIEMATGDGIQALAPALRALGWQRSQVRIAGPARIVWVAPGAKNPQRAVGRPRTTPMSTTDHEGATTP